MSAAYIWISFAIGVAQVLDCVLYLRTVGRASITGWAFSTVEFLWGAVSLYILFFTESDVADWLPASFIAYLASWTIYGVFTAKRHSDLRNIKLTPNEVLTGGAFGSFFAAASLYLAS
jgi:hypothetical protein